MCLAYRIMRRKDALGPLASNAGRAVLVLHVALACTPTSRFRISSPQQLSSSLQGEARKITLLTQPDPPCTTFGLMDGASSGLHNPPSACCTSEDVAAQPSLLVSDLVLSY